VLPSRLQFIHLGIKMNKTFRLEVLKELFIEIRNNIILEKYMDDPTSITITDLGSINLGYIDEYRAE
jgi:hypothetical protein